MRANQRPMQGLDRSCGYLGIQTEPRTCAANLATFHWLASASATRAGLSTWPSRCIPPFRIHFHCQAQLHLSSVFRLFDHFTWFCRLTACRRRFLSCYLYLYLIFRYIDSGFGFEQRELDNRRWSMTINYKYLLVGINNLLSAHLSVHVHDYVNGSKVRFDFNIFLGFLLVAEYTG